jgi:hypothetical protein
MTRQLETTESMALQALYAEHHEGLELWLIKDAAASHELLALVRRLAYRLTTVQTTPGVRDDLEAAAPWLDN